MATYGIDFYLRTKYGTSSAVPIGQQSLSVAPFTATQFDYGQIQLAWSYPQGSWTTFRLIRNRSGVPSYEDDGDILLQQTTTTGVTTSYLDYDPLLGQGGFWYYAIYLETAFDAWAAGYTYHAGDRILYSGTSYTAILSSTGVTPGTDPTIWVANAATTLNWSLVAGVTALPVSDFGYTDRLWGVIPDPYKTIFTEITATDSVPTNTPLYQFLKIFGFALDTFHTEYDQILHSNHINGVSLARIKDIAAQFGIPLEASAPGRLQRLQLASYAEVARSRGTVAGIRSAINAATGWDATIVIGPNMMLNNDQTSFVHPFYSDWRADINYPVGERVNYGNYIYEAKVGGAYGSAQKPPATAGTSNTWWQWFNNFSNANTVLLNPATGGISTWGPLAFPGPSTVTMVITEATADAINSQDLTRNQLVVTNSSGATTDIGASSVTPIQAPTWSSVTQYVTGNYVTYTPDGNVYRAKANSLNVAPTSDTNKWARSGAALSPTVDRLQINRDGVPLPHSYAAYDSSVAYAIGNIVSYSGFLYTALVAVSNVAPTGYPTDNGSWSYLRRNTDFYTGSFYSTARGGASLGYQTTTSAFIDFYTADGGSLGRALVTTNPWYFTGFDSNLGVTSHSGLTLDGGYGVTAAWSEYNGTWGRDKGFAYPYAGGAARNLATYTHLYAPSGRSDGWWLATFRSPIPAKEMGVMFRRSDSANFWVATRTGLWKYVAGVKTVVASWTALADGDRIRCVGVGTAVSVVKYLAANINGNPAFSTLAAVTDGFNSTATGAGLFAEVAADAGLTLKSGCMDDYAVVDINNMDPCRGRVYNYYSAINGPWIRPWMAAAAPEEYKDGAGVVLWKRAEFAAVGGKWLAVLNGVWHYLDKAQFEKTDPANFAGTQAPTTWHGAREINITVLADRINLIPNPGFNVNATTSWSGFGPAPWTISRDAAVGKSNLGSLKLVLPVHTGAYTGGGSSYTATYPSIYGIGYGTIGASSTGQWYGVQTATIALTPGKRYTASGWVKPDVACAPVGIAVDNVGYGSSTATVPTAKPTDVVNGWIRIQFNFTCPVGVTTTTIRFFINHADQVGLAASSNFWLDDVMLETAYTAGSYFDADFAGVDYLWSGATNNSISRFYRGRRSKQYRLDDIITKAIPLGASYTTVFA